VKRVLQALWVGATAMVPAAGLAVDGRWEGLAAVPGQAAVPVVIEFTTIGATPSALLTLPGRSVQRTRLTRFEQRAGQLRATAAVGEGTAVGDAVGVELRESEGGRRLVGVLRQGGHAAPLTLRRTGDAAPVSAIGGVVLPPSVHGVWRGRYDLGFGAREATLRLAATQASMTIVGRRTSNVTLDEAAQRGALLMLRSNDAGLAIEAPVAGAAQGVLAATLRLGPFETALELRREAHQ
jgi:hypothetical protein